MFWSWTTNKPLNPANLNGFKTAYKAADETVSNSTTLQDDDDLYFAVGSGETWAFMIWALFSGTTTGDIKFSITFPSSSSCPWGLIGSESGTITSVNNVGFATPGSGVENFSVGGTGASNTRTALIAGTCFAGTAGTVRLQFAMNTSDVGQVARMRRGSNLIAVRLD